MQRELLRAAVDCCKVGGTIVYSTCSIAFEENEGVIDYIIKKRFVKIVETGLPIDKEGITSYEGQSCDPRVRLTRRVYPHMHNMDGFFIAKLIKFKNGKKEEIGVDSKVKSASVHTHNKVQGIQKDNQVQEQKKRPTLDEIKKISKKNLGKRDRAKLKGKRKNVNFSKPEEYKEGDQIIEEEPLVKRKAAIREKLALLKKKKVL